MNSVLHFQSFFTLNKEGYARETVQLLQDKRKQLDKVSFFEYKYISIDNQ